MTFFAIEYCLISHKNLDKEKTCPQNISEILVYIHEIWLHVFFK